MLPYVQTKGDFIRLTFDHQSGHEQKGRRPALVVSNRAFNQATGLSIVCPITHSKRNIPFHVSITKESSLTGYVMAEQVKSIDYKSRQIKFIEKASETILADVLSVLDACIYQDA